jgi:hypothetical protein
MRRCESTSSSRYRQWQWQGGPRRKLDQRLDELSERRIEVIAISAEPRERFEQLQADWKLERLPIAYGLADPSMREWACSSRGAGATTNRRFSTSH